MEKTAKKHRKLDRRSARSKRLIIDALRELILEKEYDDITVSDIVDRADIGRATFYAHFEDKEDLGRFLFGLLIGQIEAELGHYIAKNQTDSNLYQDLVPSYALFKVAEQKHAWFKKNAPHPDIGLIMLQNPLVNRLENKLDSMNVPKESEGIPRRITSTFLISALIAILIDWLINDMPISVEDMDFAFQSLAAPNLKRLLNE